VITHHNVETLLATASFFDVAALASLVSDWVFCALSTSTVVRFVNMVAHCEYGEPGKVRPITTECTWRCAIAASRSRRPMPCAQTIEDASFAYLHRNAIDIFDLHKLPIACQVGAHAPPT
jgi:hypothetical protein